MDVLLYPYLPLRQKIKIGPWTLAPPSAISDSDVAGPTEFDLVQGLVGIYKLPSNASNMGAVAWNSADGLGARIDREAMSALSSALIMGLLDTNPDHLVPDEDRSGNEGHMAVSADNALAFGHPLQRDGYVAYESGAVSTTLFGGLNVLQQRNMIPHPTELLAPILGRDLETYYLNSLYDYLATNNSTARQLGRAIDWLDLAWRNSESVNLELRIVALRTSFEILFDESESVPLRRELSALLEGDRAARTAREVDTGRGRIRSLDLSDLEYWFALFTNLRNKITHGDELDRAVFLFDGHNHLWIALNRLKQSIDEMVARAGFPDLRMNYGSRTIRSSFRAAGVDPDHRT